MIVCFPIRGCLFHSPSAVYLCVLYSICECGSVHVFVCACVYDAYPLKINIAPEQFTAIVGLVGGGWQQPIRNLKTHVVSGVLP